MEFDFELGMRIMGFCLSRRYHVFFFMGFRGDILVLIVLFGRTRRFGGRLCGSLIFCLVNGIS